jgi:hypothetical protein
MGKQPSRERGDEPRTGLPPTREPAYAGYLDDEEDAARSAGEDGDGGAPRGEGGGGEGEGRL